MLLALASPASSIRLASDNARVIEDRGIVLLFNLRDEGYHEHGKQAG
jgi:hypothetical protein